MQIVVHAGMQKTGSTAIQDFLDGQRDALEGAGIRYPWLGHRSHHFVAKALSPDPSRFHRLAAVSAEEDSPEAAAAALASLRTLLADPAADRVILSHEGFSVGAIARSLSEVITAESPVGTKVAVIAYMRSPLEHFPSAIQNALRSANARIAPPSRWRSTHSARARELADAFGDRLVLRLFSRAALKDGDVVADFADVASRRLGVEMPLPSPSVNNSSLSGTACCLLYMARAMPANRLPRRQFEVLRSRIARVDKEGKWPKLAVPPVWRDELAATNGPAWNRTVPQLDLSEDRRAAAMIPVPEEAPPSTGNQELHDWLTSYFDADFVAQVSARVGGAAPQGEAVKHWLESATQTGGAFAPDPGVFTPAR